MPTDDTNRLAALQRRKYELWMPHVATTASLGSRRPIVAEGDSWFNYALGFDILDHLRDAPHSLDIRRVSAAGDTLENMAYGTEIRRDFSRKQPDIEDTLAAIRKHQPRVLLLSSGGNDVAGPELSAFLNHATDVGQPTIRASHAQEVFAASARAFRYIFARAWEVDPALHIVFHGYGHPVPDGRGAGVLFVKMAGPWLRPYLAKKGIEGGLAEQVVAQLIDQFNGMLAQLASGEPRLHYLDLREIIRRDDWVNELHLSDGGFGRVAAVFSQVIATVG
jgi:hypothetical protein